jgi:hypothetical protein
MIMNGKQVRILEGDGCDLFQGIIWPVVSRNWAPQKNLHQDSW